MITAARFLLLGLLTLPAIAAAQPPPECSQITESAALPAPKADTIVCDSLLQCKFDPAGDTDLFDWTVPANTVGWIKISGTPWAQWCLEPGAVKCSYGVDTTPKLSAGTKKILTQDTHSYVGDYYLSLQGVSSAYRCGPPIACEDVKSGTFETAADTDTFKFTSTPSTTTLDLNIVGTSWAQWCVFSSAGAVMQCGYGKGQVPLPSTDSYTIGVHDSHNYTGNYTLSLQCL